MSPNPSTVYTEEFEDDADSLLDRDESLAADSDGVGASPGDGLADGVPGSNHDDSVVADVDTVAKVADNTSSDVHIQHISRLESECQEYEAAWLKLKAESKAAFAELDAAQCRLRSYIRSLSIPMPLFEGAGNDSPAGEDGPGDSEICQELDGQIDERLDGGEVCSVGGFLHGSGAVADEADPEWSVAELSGILPSGIAKKFAGAELRTMGDVAAFFQRGCTYADIKGIGPSKQSAIEDCFEEFWKQFQG